MINLSQLTNITLAAISPISSPTNLIQSENIIQDDDWSQTACEIYAGVLGAITGPLAPITGPIMKKGCDDSHNGTTILNIDQAMKAAENYVDGYQHSDRPNCNGYNGCRV